MDVTVSHIPDSGHSFLLTASAQGDAEPLELSLFVSSCDAPRDECPCMDTTLYLFAASELERADRAAELDFDIDTLECTTRADPAGLLAGRETWLKDFLRSGLGHLIAARVRRRKLAKDAYREVDWSNYKRGELISFHEAHPREFDLVVVLDGQRYWVRDQYCVTPRCDCQEAVFEVLPVAERCGEQIRADLKQECIAGFVSERARRVWASVIDEYGWAALRERRAKMRKLARYIAPQMQPYEAPLRAPVRPGRNDPCSCGSGKKYKKCCAATEAAR